MLAWLRSLFTWEDPHAFGTPRSPGWPPVRKAWLRENPLCLACGTLKDVVPHHITPVWVEPSLELDFGNLVSLCDGPTRSCHFVFGHCYNWRGWNPQVRADAVRFSLRVLESKRLARQRAV